MKLISLSWTNLIFEWKHYRIHISTTGSSSEKEGFVVRVSEYPSENVVSEWIFRE